MRDEGSNRAAPDSTLGWGRPDVSAAAVFAEGVVPLAPLPPALVSITPVFSWTVGSIPGFAQPVSYRLRIARDSSLTPVTLDTVLATPLVALPRPLQPGAPMFWQVDATSAMGSTASTGPVGPITVPAWARLNVLADSAGSTTSEVQPTFRWSPAAVASPPGPFTYDFFVRRTNTTVPQFTASGLSDTTYQLAGPLERDAAYRWGLVVRAGADSAVITSPAPFLVLDAATPPATLLYQNFPNPFPTPTSAATCIWFDLALPGEVTLEILNLRGGVVRRLIPGSDFPAFLPAGRYGRGNTGTGLCDPRLTWDGRADDGAWLPAGVYLYKLKFGGVIQFKRIVYRGRTS